MFRPLTAEGTIGTGELVKIVSGRAVNWGKNTMKTNAIKDGAVTEAKLGADAKTAAITVGGTAR